MTRRWKRHAVLVGIVLLLIAGTVWGEDEAPPKLGGAVVGEYLRFSYRTETDGGLTETITTEITRLPDGRYQVVTTTEQETGADEIRLGFFGGSFRWLGLYMSDETGDRFDLSSLDALAEQALEPNMRYMLPDGGLLQTGDRVTVTGLSGIEGIFTQADAAGVTITVVLADDPELRRLLPFPLRVQIEYEEGDADFASIFFSGTVELVEFTRTRDPGGTP